MLILAHLAITCFLTGLIWLVQVVQYPLLARVGKDAFQAYHAGHTTQISYVVGPAMLLELILTGWLLFERPNILTVLGAVLLGIVWASTAFLQVPQHAKLSSGYHLRTVQALVLGNWIRTICWTTRAGLALILAAQILRGF
jgi:uncharacterized membrane protein YczE